MVAAAETIGEDESVPSNILWAYGNLSLAKKINLLFSCAIYTFFSAMISYISLFIYLYFITRLTSLCVRLRAENVLNI